MTSSLEPRIAIITGAASGVGKSISKAFLKAGATVVACDVNEKMLKETTSEISSLGTIDVVVADLTKLEALEDLVKGTRARHGRLDILVNNAGIFDGLTPVGELEYDLYSRVVAVNLTAPTMLTKFAVQEFLREDRPGPKGGVILNIGSICSRRGGLGGAVYTITKHGLLGLTRSTTAQYWKKNIRCNIFLAGGMKTNILTTMNVNPTGAATSKSIKGLLDPEPVDTDELAKMAVFVCSDDASFLNGASIATDHGWQAL